VNLYCGQNHTIQDNLAYNLGGPDDGNYGYGILLMGDASAQILNNQVMTTTQGAIFMQNNHSPNDTLISGNVITDAGIGLGWNMLYGSDHQGVVENNRVYSASLGMQVTSIQVGSITVQNNTFTLTQPDAWGFLVWNTSPDTTFINQNTIEGGEVGVYLYDNEPAFGFGQAYLSMAENVIDGAAFGIVSSSESGSHPVALAARDNVIQNVNTTGVVISGTEALTATVVGGTLDAMPMVFDMPNASGDLTAYANNVTNFTDAGLTSAAGTFNARHNWWGTHSAQPTGVDNDSWAYRLGAPVSGWGEGTLGDAALTTAGGSGTGIIVSHGRGLANVPFGKGEDPHASDMCSDYYDFFVLNPGGDWTVSVPTDARAECDATRTDGSLYQFVLSGDQPDAACDGGDCWNLPSGVTLSGDQLEVTVSAVSILQGTPFVAGDASLDSTDPTAITLDAFGASPAWTWAPIAGLLVGVLGMVILRRKRGS
jgi:hypothetical protein